jgi:hypothetical protein
MSTFEGEMFEGEGPERRYTYAYVKFLREQERAERDARARAEAEARGEFDAELASKIADDMDAWYGRPPFSDPIDEIVERVSKEDAS